MGFGGLKRPRDGPELEISRHLTHALGSRGGSGLFGISIGGPAAEQSWFKFGRERHSRRASPLRTGCGRREGSYAPICPPAPTVIRGLDPRAVARSSLPSRSRRSAPVSRRLLAREYAPPPKVVTFVYARLGFKATVDVSNWSIHPSSSYVISHPSFSFLSLFFF